MAIGEVGPGGHLLTAWNLSDVPNPTTALTNLGVSSPGGWIAFPYAATWSDWSSPGYQGGQYRLRYDGEVEIRGLAKSTGALVANTTYVMGTLPTGFRPGPIEVFGTLCNSSAAGGPVQININGSNGSVNVTPAGAVAANGWIMLSGIRFVQVN